MWRICIRGNKLVAMLLAYFVFMVEKEGSVRGRRNFRGNYLVSCHNQVAACI